MAFLTDFQVQEIKNKIIDDKSLLGKIYKTKNDNYQTASVEHSLVDEYIKKGWEVFGKPLKTKTKIRIEKSHSKKFEDDIWCQFYTLGYRMLNFDDKFVLPFSKDPNDKKQIDVVAINDEAIFLIECKSSKSPGPAKLLKDEFDLLSLRLDGFRKALWQIFGREKKIKYIFATRNQIIPKNSIHFDRLKKTNSFYYNDNTYDYVNSLIKNYKNAAFYQFLGLVFKNELINTEKIEIPTLKGKMGNKEYFMFSIEPSLLLKMGFILHRTRANESEFPTYQRLLVPSRLKGITKFIDDGGYFPNSIVINFNDKKNKIQFELSSKKSSTSSSFGTLKIPNSYGIAYIIDGQHRVYGYANSGYKESNTIPVVAFINLDSIEQLELFMEINENQKAVSPSLRLDLAEDLNWDSERADSRLLALRSSITKELGNKAASPLFKKISIGEDKALLTFKPFMSALTNSGLLPIAKGNKYNDESLVGSLYNINNQDHNQEMLSTKKKIVDLIITCYTLVEEKYPAIFNADKYFIVSNRGTYAFISLVGSLNRFNTEQGLVNKNSTSDLRFESIKKYLAGLLDSISTLNKDEEIKQLTLLGAGADMKWLRFFQTLVNKSHNNYNPTELIDWKERQNEDLQIFGRKYGVGIEKFMKSKVLGNLKSMFRENWELEINTIKTKCQTSANAEMERYYKEFKESKHVDWTEMFGISDYKTIIDKYFDKRENIDENNAEFKTFKELFSIDIGLGFKKNKEKTRWISKFGSLRNNWAHEASKNTGLNKEEVELLEKIHNSLLLN